LEAVVGEATNGAGVDLALNGVGSSIFGPLIGSLRAGGRQVLYSAAGGREARLDILSFYRNDLALFGLDTQKMNATACAEILNALAPLFDSGALKPPTIAKRYDLSQAAEAYSKVAAGGGGKVIFVMPEKDARI
jgi:NADPH:quinone reductase-like Zn-dependent oxidoreductase